MTSPCIPHASPPASRWLQVYPFSGYPKVWKRGIVQNLLVDWADHHCEECGATDDQASLHVHHLVWKAKNDCRWENLVVVCVGCHTKLHNRGWQPGQVWNVERWGEVPQWAIARELLTQHPEH